MANLLSQQLLAQGFDPRRIANDRRFNQAQRDNTLRQDDLAAALRQEQIKQSQIAQRSGQLSNVAKAREMARGPSNQFKRIQGKDGNSYEVEISPNGQIVGQPKMVEGLGVKSPTLDRIPEGARQHLPPNILLDPSSASPEEFNTAAIDAIGKWKAATNAPDREKQFDKAGKLRGEINKATEDFKKIESAYGRVQASAQNPSAAGDMALIFNYMKILDPGSTVREGEFATAQNAGGVDTRIRNVFNKVRNGQMLDESQRIDFLSQAENLYKNQKSIADKRTQNIIKIGSRFGIDKNDLLSPDISELSDTDLEAALAELDGAGGV